MLLYRFICAPSTPLHSTSQMGFWSFIKLRITFLRSNMDNTHSMMRTLTRKAAINSNEYLYHPSIGKYVNVLTHWLVTGDVVCTSRVHAYEYLKSNQSPQYALWMAPTSNYMILIWMLRNGMVYGVRVRVEVEGVNLMYILTIHEWTQWMNGRWKSRDQKKNHLYIGGGVYERMIRLNLNGIERLRETSSDRWPQEFVYFYWNAVEFIIFIRIIIVKWICMLK